jgi:hypothetical protein
MLVEDLKSYQQQFLSIKSEAQILFGQLIESQLNWQPGSNRWSVAQCLDHLLVTGRNSLSHIYEALDDARSRGLMSQGPFRYGMIERWFVRQMEPRAGMRFKAPKAYLPSANRLSAEILPSFYVLQGDFLLCIEAANGIDLSRTKVNNPVSKWFRLSIGQELAFNAAHERRHLWQARLVTQEQDFPSLPPVA